MRKPALKPLDRQTIVITGASSGIGLATARLAAQRGAKLVLLARSRDALEREAEELRRQGAEVVTSIGDVGRREDVEALAAAAIERFGGFDSWVNNAGVSAFGKVWEIPEADHRRIFDTDYWGVVHGSLTALAHLRDRSGAIINVGSVISDIPFPMQTPYTAAKHAVKGFTDALRMEIENERLPVAVTLIKPASVDTPFEIHAANHMDREPSLPPPVFAPELVAEAILNAAERPTRETYVGHSAVIAARLRQLVPGLTDELQRQLSVRLQQRDRPAVTGDRPGLHEAGGGGGARSGRHRFVVGDAGPGQRLAMRSTAVALALGASCLALALVAPRSRRWPGRLLRAG